MVADARAVQNGSMSVGEYAARYGTAFTGTIAYDRNANEAYKLYVSNGSVTGYDRLASINMMNLIASTNKFAGLLLQTQGGGNYSFGAIGWAPLEYEAGKGSTQSVAKYEMRVNVSVYEVPEYGKDGKIIQYKSKAKVSATSFVSAKGGSRVIPSAWASINVPGSTGGYLEKLELKATSPAYIKGGGQYTYVGEATFDLSLNPAFIITFGGSWVIQYDNGMRFLPINAPYIGIPISVGGQIRINP